MISQQRINHQLFPNHTHNHLIEIEETSALPGRKTGSLVGLSQIDSSHLTEREARD